MLSLSDNNQTDIIEAFNPTSRYLDDLLNIDNPYFTGGKPRNYHEIVLTLFCSQATSGTRRGSFQVENWINKGKCHIHFRFSFTI